MKTSEFATEYIATALSYLAEAVDRERQAGRAVAPWCVERAEQLIRILAEPPYVMATAGGGLCLTWQVDQVRIDIRPTVTVEAHP